MEESDKRSEGVAKSLKSAQGWLSSNESLFCRSGRPEKLLRKRWNIIPGDQMSDPFTSTHLASAFNGRRRLLFPFALVHVSWSNCIDFQLFFPAQNIINYYVNYFVTLSQECRLCWTLVCHVNSCLLWGQCRGAGGGRGKWKYPLQWQQEKSTATVLNGMDRYCSQNCDVRNLCNSCTSDQSVHPSARFHWSTAIKEDTVASFNRA